MDCASVLKYSHLIVELNEVSKLMVVTLYSSVHGATQLKNKQTNKDGIQHLKLHFAAHVMLHVSFPCTYV